MTRRRSLVYTRDELVDVRRSARLLVFPLDPVLSLFEPVRRGAAADQDEARARDEAARRDGSAEACRPGARRLRHAAEATSDAGNVTVEPHAFDSDPAFDVVAASRMSDSEHGVPPCAPPLPPTSSELPAAPTNTRASTPSDSAPTDLRGAENGTDASRSRPARLLRHPRPSPETHGAVELAAALENVHLPPAGTSIGTGGQRVSLSEARSLVAKLQCPFPRCMLKGPVHTSADSLERHLRKHRGSGWTFDFTLQELLAPAEKNLRCTWRGCGKTFAAESTFRNHLSSHSKAAAGPKPKRPPSAFLLFRSDIRPQLLAADSRMTAAAVSRTASQQWADMPADDKKGYQERASQAMASYRDRLASFVAAGGADAEPDADADSDSDSAADAATPTDSTDGRLLFVAASAAEQHPTICSKDVRNSTSSSSTTTTTTPGSSSTATTGSDSQRDVDASDPWTGAQWWWTSQAVRTSAATRPMPFGTSSASFGEQQQAARPGHGKWQQQQLPDKHAAPLEPLQLLHRSRSPLQLRPPSPPGASAPSFRHAPARQQQQQQPPPPPADVTVPAWPSAAGLSLVEDGAGSAWATGDDSDMEMRWQRMMQAHLRSFAEMQQQLPAEGKFAELHDLRTVNADESSPGLTKYKAMSPEELLRRAFS